MMGSFLLQGAKRFIFMLVILMLGILTMGANYSMAAPTVTSVSPPAGANGVPVNTAINVAFSENMNPATITNSTVTLSKFTGMKAIAAGTGHTVALKKDGTIAAWGDNSYGQTMVPKGLNGVTAIAAGDGHTVAVKSNGTVVAWGKNMGYSANGNITGLITTGQINVPTGLTGVTAVAAGEAHTVALKMDGTVVAWGSNDYGQTTVPTGLTGVTAIAAGYRHTVALKNDGSIVAWGSDTQYGVPALTGITAIAAGYNSTVALKNNGTVVAWGSNYNGEATVPTGLTGVTAVAAGAGHTVALKNDGTVVAWGSNYYGQTTMPEGLTGVIAIAAGSNHTVALKNDGTIAVWGENYYGQAIIPTALTDVTAIASNNDHAIALKNDGVVVTLGRNTFGQTMMPTGLTGVTAIAAGVMHTVALKNDGTAVAWGDDFSGQATVPTGLTGVTAIAAGFSHTVALKNNGTVVAWGDNSDGQTDIPYGLVGVTAIAAGSFHNVALKTDGTVVAWGRHNYSVETTIPTGLTEVTAIAAGTNHTVALKRDGTVVAWGYNSIGQTTVPTGLTGVTAIAAGAYHTVALKNDGTVVAWGDNSKGQSTVPVGLTGVRAIAAGSNDTFAILNDGTVVGWGTYPMFFSPVGPHETAVPATITYDATSHTATVTPIAPLAGNTSYEVKVNTGARSATGISLPADRSSSFTTEMVEDFPQIDATPATLDFGNSVILISEALTSLTISNSGSSDLIIEAMTFSGPDAGNFTFAAGGTCSSLTPVFIASGTSCTVNLKFKPTTIGTKTASLVIASNSAINPILAVPIGGTGVSQMFNMTLKSIGEGTGAISYSTGGTCTGNCSQSFAVGTTIQLTATPDTGSDFGGWSGCDAYAGQTCTVNINGPKNVNTYFATIAKDIPIWSFIDSPFSNLNINSIAIDANDPSVVYAATSGGVYKSSNSGANWASITTPALGVTEFSTLVIDPLTPATLYASAINASSSNGVYKTINGGTDWSRYGMNGVYIHALIIDPVDPDILYAGTHEHGVYKSVDGGVNWQQTTWNTVSIMNTASIYSLAIDKFNPGTIYAAGGGLFKSTDGGANWNNILPDTYVGAVAVDDGSPGTVYAGINFSGNSNKMLKTVDGGANWTVINNGLSSAGIQTLVIDPSRPGTVYAGTWGSGVFRTTNWGYNWVQINEGLAAVDILALALTPSDPSVVYAGTYRKGLYKISTAGLTGHASLSLTPISLNLGTVATYSSSTTQTITLRSNGVEDLVIFSTTISGSAAGNFFVTPGTCPNLTPTLTPGTSCTFEVTFNPTTAGSRVATLLINSNDLVQPMAAVGLSGSAYDSPPLGNVMINGGSAHTTATAVMLTISAMDNSGIVSEMRFSNNNTSWSGWEIYNSSKNWQLMTIGGDGQKRVYAQFRDEAGNISASFSDSIILDTTAPVVSFSATPPNFYSYGAGIFNYAANEEVASYECKIDGGSFLPCGTSYSFSLLADGNHTFSVRATDLAGLTGAATDYTFTIGTVPPDSTLLTYPSISTNLAIGSFTFSSTAAGSTFECSLDGATFASCISGISYTGLQNGLHTFRVRSVDVTGNSDPTPASYQWTVYVPPKNLKVSVDGQPDSYFDTLSSAFAALPYPMIEMRTFSVRALVFPEDLVLNNCWAFVRLRGGYNSDFSSVVGESVFGSLTVTCGTIVVDNVVIK